MPCDLGGKECLKEGAHGARGFQRRGQRHTPEGIGQIGLFQLLQVLSRSLLRDATDVLFPRGLEATRVPAREHGQHEPTPHDVFAFALAQALVLPKAQIQRIRKVQRVLRTHHVWGYEAGRLDHHDEVVEVVLLDDVEQRAFQLVVRPGDPVLIDLPGLGVPSRELADDARRFATAEAHQTGDADDVAVRRVVEILRLALQPFDGFEVRSRSELVVVVLDVRKGVGCHRQVAEVVD